MYYVNERWLGGMLTNYKTIATRIKKLNEIKAMEEDGTFDALTKKEVLKLRAEAEKLEKYLGGIKEMTSLPDALFVIDVGYHKIAISEANKLGSPGVAVVDTNCSPEGIDYVIPGNDDSSKAVKIYAAGIADAVLAGKADRATGAEEAPAEEFVEVEATPAA